MALTVIYCDFFDAIALLQWTINRRSV